jgi:hypothetical protein
MLAALATALTVALGIGGPLAAIAAPIPGTGTITGTVNDGATPVGGVSVAAFPAGGGMPASTTSDANGFYELTGLAFANYSIGVYPGIEYQPPSVPQATVDQANPIATRDVSLERWPTGTASISGTVIDKGTSAPIARASVSLSGFGDGHPAVTTSDDSGEFSFSLLPEQTYAVTFWADGYVLNSQEVTVGANESAIVNAALMPANSGISGRITNQAGNPVAGLTLSAQLHSDPNVWGSGWSDADGNFTISGISEGTYTVSMGGVSTPYVYQERTVVALANKVTPLNIVVKPRTTGSIGGVILTVDGFAIEGICPVVLNARTEKVVKVGEPSPAEGTYLVDGLKPGKYTVRFVDCDKTAPNYRSTYLGGSKTFLHATFITVAAAQDNFGSDVTLELKKPKKPHKHGH